VGIADQVGGLFWTDREETTAPGLTADQREAIRQLAESLPEHWRQRFEALTGRNEDDDGEEGPVPAAV
jgi:hypothetical protein